MKQYRWDRNWLRYSSLLVGLYNGRREFHNNHWECYYVFEQNPQLGNNTQQLIRIKMKFRLPIHLPLIWRAMTAAFTIFMLKLQSNLQKEIGIVISNITNFLITVLECKMHEWEKPQRHQALCQHCHQSLFFPHILVQNPLFPAFYLTCTAESCQSAPENKFKIHCQHYTNTSSTQKLNGKTISRNYAVHLFLIHIN